VKSSLTEYDIHVAKVKVYDCWSPDQEAELIIQGPLAPSFYHGERKLLMVTNAQMSKRGQISINFHSRLIMASEKPGIDVTALFERQDPWQHGIDAHGMTTNSILEDLFNPRMAPRRTLARLKYLISKDPTAYHQARVTVQMSRLNYTSLWLRHKLFYFYCPVCSKVRYSNSNSCYYDKEAYGPLCHRDMAMFDARPNPHLVERMWDWSCSFSWLPDTSLTDLGNDESCQAPNEQSHVPSFNSPLLITNRAFETMVSCHRRDFSDDVAHNLGDRDTRWLLNDHENFLDGITVEARLGWFSMTAPHLKRMNIGESVLSGDQEITPTTEEGVGGQLVLLDVDLVSDETSDAALVRSASDGTIDTGSQLDGMLPQAS